MKSSSTARDHLLGRLEVELREAADERILTDPAYYNELLGEEQLLLEQYVAGSLPAADAEAFRQLCLNRPDLSQHVELERRLPGALHAALGPPAVIPVKAARSLAGRHSQYKGLLAIAAGLIVAVAVSAGYLAILLKGERSAAVAREQQWKERDGRQRAEIAQLGKERRVPAAGGLLASAIIRPSIRGEARPPALPVPDKEGWVELQFKIGVDTHFESYRVVIEDGDVTLANVEAPSRTDSNYRLVSVIVPATLPRDRVLTASIAGVKSGRAGDYIEEYNFRLTTAPAK
jgi:hypothetical protein